MPRYEGEAERLKKEEELAMKLKEQQTPRKRHVDIAGHEKNKASHVQESSLRRRQSGILRDRQSWSWRRRREIEGARRHR